MWQKVATNNQNFTDFQEIAKVGTTEANNVATFIIVKKFAIKQN